ncbi:MAG TPA: oligosaccharide flippase family protein [Solirubrobacteraceae bacterium]
MTTIIPRRFGRSVASSYLLTATVGVIALVMTPVLARSLGKEAFGVWALASSLMLYFKLLEFGVGKALPRYVAEYSVSADGRRLSQVISTACTLLFGLAAAGFAAALAIAAVFPDVFDVPEGLHRAAQVTVAIVMFDICMSIAADAFGWTLIGLQRFDLINGTLIAVLVGQAVAWAIVLAAGGGIVALAIASAAVSLAGQGARYVLARRLLPDVEIAPRRAFNRALVRPFLRQSTWLGVIDVATILVFRLDVVLVGLVVGVPEAGVYAVGQKLTFALEQLIQPTTKPFFPHASELAARGDVAGLRSSLLAATRMSLLVAVPLAITLLVLAPHVVDVWVGSEFEAAAPAIQFLAGAAIVMATTRAGLLMLQGTSEPRVPALIFGGEAILNVALSVALGFAMGLEGVALGTLIAAAVGALVFVPYMCARFALRITEFLGPLLGAHVPCAAAALAIGWVATRTTLDTIPLVVGAGLAMVAAYLAVYLVTGMDAGERRRVRAFLRPREVG